MAGADVVRRWFVATFNLGVNLSSSNISNKKHCYECFAFLRHRLCFASVHLAA